MMRRVAVYTGSRNLYKHMVVAATSLLENADVDKIYLLVQDDTFPYRLPHTEVRNVSGQRYFLKQGPNMNNQFTYLAMMRAALAHELEQDRVLSLDVDTIVVDDISEVWDLDIEEYYLAGVRTVNKRERGLYVNAGALLLNLKKLRDGTADKVIDILNNRSLWWVDEQAYNYACKEKILEMSSDYNVCIYTPGSKHPKIIHYAGFKEWEKFKDYKVYERKAEELGYLIKK